MDDTGYHKFLEDFDKYVAGDWTITEVGTGTRALTDADGGALLITNAAADNDGNFFNKKGESFKFETGKALYFEARFKVSDATQSDFVVGLQITDTTPLDVTDGIFFQKDDGDANLDFHAEKNSTASDLTAIHTVVADTYMVVAFYYDGSTAQINVFVDGAQVGYVPLTNVVDDEELTVSFGIQNGEAAAKTMTVDYIFVAKER
jgi:hypothetical protein